MIGVRLRAIVARLRGPARPRLRRVFGPWHGPARPGGRALAVLGGALVAILGGVAFVYGWALHTADPARTLALAARLLDRPVALEAALDVNWNQSIVLDDEASRQTSLDLLDTPLPPAMCMGLDTATGPWAGTPLEVDQAVSALDAAIERGTRADLEARIASLLRFADAGPGTAAGFVVRYNLARGYLAARDEASAARVLEAAFNDRYGYLGVERLPISSSLAEAGLRIRAGEVDEAIAARGFYARTLAGAIAHGRGELPRAISHFRLALNAINYVMAPRDSTAPDTHRGHYQRIEVPLYDACTGTGPDRILTSLDAYAALVRAYLVADEFHDTANLEAEVRRGRFDMDADDPFAPLLRYAEAADADGLANGPIPENFIWSASNLQRVYHHNRRDPDPRLEVARGALVLRLVDRPEWLHALEPFGGGDACRLLVRVASDLAEDGRALAVARAARPAADSALAAVAVNVFGRARRHCGGEVAGLHVGAGVRSAWLRLGGRFIGGGMAGRYEAYRAAIVDALAAVNASEAVLAERVAEPVGEVRAQLASFEAGRTPPVLAAAIEPAAGAGFVRDWWQAVFLDVANELCAAVRGGPTDSPLRLRAGQVQDFLTALNSAIAHAGARPADLYTHAEFAPYARALGTRAGIGYWFRYQIRSHSLFALVPAAAGLLLGAAAVAVYVNVWRFRLLTRYRLYYAEVQAREEAERA